LAHGSLGQLVHGYEDGLGERGIPLHLIAKWVRGC
jgi:hypothetical protein